MVSSIAFAAKKEKDMDSFIDFVRVENIFEKIFGYINFFIR